MSTQPSPPDPNEPVETPFADAASPFKRTRAPIYAPPPQQPPRPPMESTWVTYRSQINFGLSMLAYLMVLVGAITVVQANPDAQWRYFVALLPVAPAAVGVLIFVRALMRLDDVHARIQLHSLGVSVGATAVITFGYAFYEGAGMPHLPPAYVLPMMAIFWGLGTIFFTWRYRL